MSKLYGVIAALILVAQPVRAEDYIAPDQITVTTPTYHPQFSEFEPLLGSYEYEVTWQGIPAATAELSVERDGQNYKIVTTAKTYRAIDIFYKLRYRAEGLMSALDLSPIKSTFEQRENSRQKLTEIAFEPNGEIHSTYEYKGKDFKEFRFNPNNPTLDPFSAAFLARSLSWKIGETKEFDTFNGKSRYLIKLTATEKKQIRINGDLKDVWVVVPSVKKLTSTDADSKLRRAEIYVTDDKAREILQIKSEVFIGSVKTKLVSFTPSTAPVPGTNVAHAQTVLFE